MRLVERHIISVSHPYYKEADKLCFLSKNLYNYANYQIRQSYIKDGSYIKYNTLQKQLQSEADYKALPAKVSQQVLIQLDRNWKSFKAAKKDFEQHPEKYKGRPRLPGYKHKSKGRFPLVYTIQAISKRELKKGIVNLSGTGIRIRTDKKNIAQVRLVPGNKEYIIEIVYQKEEENLNLEKNNFISIDIGVDNLATVTSNIIRPLIVNGRTLKCINRFFNRKKARLQSFIKDKGTSNRIVSLTNKRNKKIDDYLHKASRYLVNLCRENNIGKIIIGKNRHWKSEVNMGKCNNQKFVSIPHARFISMIEYKAKLLGIEVIITEESYTSKCSFLDNEEIAKHNVYMGRRIKRGLFSSAKRTIINADVNASLNIARKVIPGFNVYSANEGVKGFVVNPIRFNPYKLKIS